MVDLITPIGLALAGLAQGLSGFAFGLFAVSTLALVHSPRTVVPAVLFLGAALHVWLLLEQRDRIRPRELARTPLATLRFVLPLAIGIAGGGSLLTIASASLGRIALGVFLLGFVGLSFAERPKRLRTGDGSPGRPVSPALGLVMGVLQGWLGTGGPLLVGYLVRAGVGREHFIPLFSSVTLLSLVGQMIAYAYFGYWTRDVFALVLASVLPATGGFVIGIASRRLIRTDETFRGVVLALLALNGAGLLVRGIARP